MLVVTVGFDKSDSYFIGTWRSCNRRRGNLSVYVQSFACIEGPVAEKYENKMKTIGNNQFPVQMTVQSLVDDSLYFLALTTRLRGKVELCSCFVFIPVPALSGKIRPIHVSHKDVTIPESMVQWSSAGLSSEREFCHLLYLCFTNPLVLHA